MIITCTNPTCTNRVNWEGDPSKAICSPECLCATGETVRRIQEYVGSRSEAVTFDQVIATVDWAIAIQKEINELPETAERDRWLR